MMDERVIGAALLCSYPAMDQVTLQVFVKFRVQHTLHLDVATVVVNSFPPLRHASMQVRSLTVWSVLPVCHEHTVYTGAASSSGPT
jgi:hypothetical protein